MIYYKVTIMYYIAFTSEGLISYENTTDEIATLDYPTTITNTILQWGL